MQVCGEGLPLQDGDVLLLCSDGLTDLVDARIGRGQRPVTNVSWEDARRYVLWLARRPAIPIVWPARPSGSMRRGRGPRPASGGAMTPATAKPIARPAARSGAGIVRRQFRPNTYGL